MKPASGTLTLPRKSDIASPMPVVSSFRIQKRRVISGTFAARGCARADFAARTRRISAAARAPLATTLAPDVHETPPEHRSALSGSLAGILRGVQGQVERGAHDAILFGDVRRRVALAGARALGPADVAEVDLVGQDLHQAREHVRAGAHVARLFLCPDDLAQVRVARDQLANRLLGER